MDIAVLSMKMAYTNIQTELGVGMMDKALDQMELVGEQLAEMIAATAVPPVVSGDGGVDIRI